MLYKGIVMEIHQKYCIVLTNNQEFVKLKNKKNTSVSQDIYFTDSDIYSQNSYSRWVFAAAIIMFGVFLSGIQIQQFYPIYSQNAAVISIDINPSIEFYVDENMKVNKVIPLNKDSYGLLSENWVGQSFHTVVNEYLDKAIENGYLKQESTILMSCASLNNNFDKNVIKKEVNDAVQEKNISDVTYGYIESNKENVKRAKKSNVSIGKYEVYLHIKDTHQDINTIEKIKKLRFLNS